MTANGGLWVEAQTGDRVDAVARWLRPVVGYGLSFGLIGSVIMAILVLAVR